MRALKILLLTATTIVVLLVIAGGVFVTTFDPNSYRDLLATTLEKATGRKLQIAGDLELTIWPNIAIRAENLTLSNPPKFGNTAMLEAAALEATVALAPLVSLTGPREVQIDGVILYQPILNLEQQTSGAKANNWQDLSEQLSEPAEAGPPMVQLRSLRVLGGKVRYSASGVSHELNELNAEFDIVQSATGPMRVQADLSGNWLAPESSLASPFTLQTNVETDGEEFKLLGTTFGATALPAPFPDHIDVQAENVQWTQLDVEVQTLTATLAAVEPLTAVIHLVVPNLRLSADFSELETDNARVGLNKQPVNAGWSLELQGADLTTKPAFKGHLHSEGENLAELLKSIAVELPEAMPANRQDTIDLAADFWVTADGVFDLQNISVKLPELAVVATGSATGSADAKVSGDLSVAAVNLRKLSKRFPEVLAPDTYASIFADAKPSAPSDSTVPPPTLDQLNTRFEWHPATPTSPDRLTFSATRLVGIGINSDISGYIDSKGFKAQTKFSTMSLKQVLTYFLDAYKTTDPKALSAVAGTATVIQSGSQSESELRIDELQLTLDKSAITGWITSTGAQPPMLEFDLNTNRLNVGDYLPPTDSEDADKAKAKAKKDSPRAPSAPSVNEALLGAMRLPTELLRSYNLNGRLSFGRLQLYDLLLADASASLLVGRGQARASALKARLYGGTLVGDLALALNQTTDQPMLSIKGDLQNIALGELLVALTDTANFTGTGAVQVDLSGSGETLLNATQSAAGDIALRMGDGVFTGVNLGHSLCTLYNKLRSLPEPAPTTNPTTTFKTFSASASVKDGEATTSDLLASNSYLNISGSGRTRLARQSIKYDLDVVLTGPIDEPNCETLTPFIGSRIPVTLSGTFANPVVRPDFGKLAKREIRRRIEEKITDKLFDLLGGKKSPEPQTPEDTPTP